FTVGGIGEVAIGVSGDSESAPFSRPAIGRSVGTGIGGATLRAHSTHLGQSNGTVRGLSFQVLRPLRLASRGPEKVRAGYQRAGEFSARRAGPLSRAVAPREKALARHHPGGGSQTHRRP